MSIYLDNAATTPIAPEVVTVMTESLKNEFGNPSSVHSFGRKSKSAIETSRRTIATHLNANASEILFTSGGTEADNMALTCAINDLGVQRIITSQIEHHAVLHTAQMLASAPQVELEYVALTPDGHVDLIHLEELLSTNSTKTLVSLMHANNEIATLLPIEKVSALCRKFDAYFHSDTVQTMGHYHFDLKALDIDFITGAAHKFHGPKGVGFLYINKKLKIAPLIHGGAQERGLRGGTENLYGIVGLAKAMDLAYDGLEKHQKHVQQLKSNMVASLRDYFKDRVDFHGTIEPSESLYTVLNVCFPETPKAGLLLFTLDLKGVACSGGSACSSGSNLGSHVLRGISADANRPNARFSFSRYTTQEEIDRTLDIIKSVFKE